MKLTQYKHPVLFYVLATIFGEQPEGANFYIFR